MLAAFVLAVVLHVGPVVWIETQPETLAVAAAVPTLTQPIEKTIPEKDAETGSAGSVAASTAVD